MLLKINNLSVQYGKAEVIKDLSLEVAEKERKEKFGEQGGTVRGESEPSA